MVRMQAFIENSKDGGLDLLEKILDLEVAKVAQESTKSKSVIH